MTLATKAARAGETLSPPREQSSFEAAIRRADGQIDDLLDAPYWRPRRPWDSEKRKSLARIKTSLATAGELHDRGVPEIASVESEIVRLLERPLAGRRLDTLIELVYALDEALVVGGDDAHIRRTLCAERMPDDDGAALTDVELALTGDPAPGQSPEDARQALRTLYEMRRFRYRRMRARRRMKTGRLVAVGTVLGLLVIALGWAVDLLIAPDASDLVPLSAVAGALGGTLALLLRLRDTLVRGKEMREFMPMLLAQPVVGAASGMIVLVAIASGFLGLSESTDLRWGTVALLAFAAGISEAFFLGIVQKAAGIVGDVKDTSGTVKP